jgi:diguanylate cyclase (GGDEF)-like protein/PAS domain S-box-containing protein
MDRGPSPLRVLLVEDDPTYARVLRYTLPARPGGPFAIETVERLSAALERLPAGGVDAVLLDARLPDAEGVEGLRRVRAQFPDVPVVLLTANEDEALGLQAVKEGAQDSLVKGRVEEDILPRALRYAVERKRLADALRRLEKAVGTMQLGVTVTDASGRIVYVNAAEAAMHGYEPAELFGHDARSLSPREDWRPAAPADLAAFHTWRRERVRLRRDGTTFPAQLLSDVVTDESGRPVGIVTTCEDITDRKRAEEALRRSEERYALAVRGTNDGIWDWDLSTGRVYYSARWKAIVGCAEHEVGDSPDEWMGRVHPEDLGRVRSRVEAHLAGRADRFEDEHRVRHRDGGYRWVLSRGFALRDEKGRAYRMAGAQTDTTDRRGYDALTGLPNRAVFLERVTEAVARTERLPRAEFAVLFVDLDRFKEINDEFGHAGGDRFLLEVARRLQDGVRPGDVVARLSGDEFAILVERLDDAETATRVADRVLQEVARPLNLGPREVAPGVSIGIALSYTGYADAAHVLRDADTAMYRAKADGRGRWEVFDRAKRERMAARQRLQDELRDAMERGELDVYFQPQVSLADGRLHGFEALLKWRGVVLPVDALSVADDAGWLARVAGWLLEAACRHMAGWQERAENARALTLAVNVPGQPFHRPGLADEMAAVLARTGLRPGTLVLEVGEEALGRADSAALAVARLAARGVRVRLDRFGAGPTSLRALRIAPLEGVKLDASLAGGLPSAPDAGGIVSAVCVAAGALGLAVTALGVENDDQRHRLREAGVRLGQGTAFGDPLTAAAVETLLALPAPGPEAAMAADAPVPPEAATPH